MQCAAVRRRLKPGEVLFNLLALLHLAALLLSAAFLSGMPELARDWRFWAIPGAAVYWFAAVLLAVVLGAGD